MMKTGLFRNSISNVVDNLNITGEAVIDTAKIKKLFAEYVEAGYVKVGYITGNKAEFQEFYAKYGVIDELVSKVINSSTIYADQIKSKDGKTFIDLVNSSLDIQKIASNEIITNTITSISSTTAKEVVDYSYIRDAIVGKMTAGELLTGDIVVTDKMRILSDSSGTKGLVINGSTMQFIGSDGKVGVQIGYGANDKPSLIIRDDNGTALFTSSGVNAGVQASAIADGLIVNNMISNNTISKDKINFPIIEPNAQGGVDITQIYDGNGNKWGVESTQFAKDIIKFKEDSEKHQQQTDTSIGTLANQIESIENSITGIETVVDKENKTIKDTVWENVYLYKPKLDANGNIQYDSGGNIITEKDAYNIIQRNNETIRTLSELTTTIYDKDLNGKTSRITTAMQTAEKFNWLVKNGSSQSSLTLTDSMLNAIVSQFKVTGSDGTSTIIEGGKIKAGSINTDLLNTSAIKSQNYQEGQYINEAGYSLSGTFLDLSNGLIHMPGYYNDLLGNTYIRGNIQATSGLIGIDEDNAWKIGSTTVITSGNTGKDYASLTATGNALISTGELQLHDKKLNTYNYGNYIKYNGSYYDYGIQSPELDPSKYSSGSNEKTAGAFIYVRKYTPKGSSTSLPQYDTGWEYLLRITKLGEIYFGDTLISGKDGAFLSTSGGTITGDLTVTGTISGNFSGSANSVSNSLSINGISYNGAKAVNIDVRNIIQGGNGSSSAAAWNEYGLVYAGSKTGLSSLGYGTVGQILKSNGAAPPEWVNIADLITSGGSGSGGISSKYVTIDTAQTITGTKSFSQNITVYSSTASTSKTTGALKVKGGIGSEGTISGDKIRIGDKCILEMDSTNNCLNFVFS